MLTANAISRITNGDQNFNPILELKSMKAVQAPNQAATGGVQRYRLVLTDGSDTLNGMLATQNNHLVESGTLKEGCVVQFKEFQLNNLNGTKIVIIIKLDVVAASNTYPATATSASVAPPAPPSSTYQAPASHTAPSPSPYPAAPNPYQTKPPNPYTSTSSGAVNPYTSAVSNAPVSSTPSTAITPISALNPYSNKWTIKARVTAKSDIRRWNNAKGEGTLFSIDLLDETGGEMKATFFKDACDKWFPVLEVQKVYLFSNGRIKMADRRYSALKSDYELNFDAGADIRPSEGAAIPTITFKPTPIAALSAQSTEGLVDVIGIVRHAGDCSEIASTKYAGRVFHKRDLVIYDQSMTDVKLTLWGQNASLSVDYSEHPILAVKGAKISDYGGCSLGTTNSSTVLVNPDLEEARALFAWKEQAGEVSTTSLSTGGVAGGHAVASIDQRIQVLDIKMQGLGLNEKPDYATIKGSITYIKHDTEPWYTACPTPNCNRKVVEGFDQKWTCEKCQKEFPNCVRRFILNMTLADASGQQWFTAFNETAEAILGITADELFEMKRSGDESSFEAVFAKALFKTVIIRSRVKEELVGDDKRLKCSIAKLETYDVVDECRQMIDAIAKYQ